MSVQKNRDLRGVRLMIGDKCQAMYNYIVIHKNIKDTTLKQISHPIAKELHF
ncbi:hypothetical protein [Pectinatus cerevisiiphilus]|uniref:Uncharacterized protein n=1 Tax=Pectinatus cerevisiiphilus TaxID=86956 RepID=A0A4R3K3M5_9FIRM|nr:hypothetical protein [Pectinatus cerevisiiphilus]TCS77241.1 hypothetical protein EDC37_11712 [Pectinatus cerevisiiphilus]